MVQAASAAVLLLAGGENVLNVLQTASLVSAFPFIFVLLFMCWALIKALREELEEEKTIKKKAS
ncbi:BCCT family transporter [Priestia filamentosa]|uniref:BCCT family transporter n=1 Tax=Priestia filamentosa TaxID=1402861 RepID=UPI0023ED793E|nr:BCCT family transporter [Priestia filamentosa]